MKPWRFHEEKWGHLTVSVMPLSLPNKVIDSNVGIIMRCDCGAPQKSINEGGTLACSKCGAVPAAVIVRDGKNPHCDLKALALVIGYENACKVLDATEPIGLTGAIP